MNENTTMNVQAQGGSSSIDRPTKRQKKIGFFRLPGKLDPDQTFLPSRMDAFSSSEFSPPSSEFSPISVGPPQTELSDCMMDIPPMPNLPQVGLLPDYIMDIPPIPDLHGTRTKPRTTSTSMTGVTEDKDAKTKARKKQEMIPSVFTIPKYRLALSPRSSPRRGISKTFWESH